MTQNDVEGLPPSTKRPKEDDCSGFLLAHVREEGSRDVQGSEHIGAVIRV